MFRLFRTNAALRSYRRKIRPVTTGVPGAKASDPVAARPNKPPARATWPTVAMPRPGRAGWLTPGQTWRANGGRW